MEIMNVIVGVIILVAVGIGIAISTTNEQLNLVRVTNETFSGVKNNTLISLAHEPVEANSEVVTNGSLIFTRNGLINYTINNADAVITWNYNNTLGVLNNASTLNITYQYRPSGYISDPTTRTVVPLIIIILGIVAMVYVAKGIDIGSLGGV